VHRAQNQRYVWYKQVHYHQKQKKYPRPFGVEKIQPHFEKENSS
jgi:hypothetical protein